tara:strand:+ start:9072 stop:10001 length:930 start_codon:yes stop_codon:yes gene_type:complete
MVNNSTETNITLSDIFQILKNKYKIIITFTSFAVLFSVLYSLFLPNIYTSRALLSIVEDNNSSVGMSSMLSQYSGLASLAGVASSGVNTKQNYAIEVINSREFLKHLLTFDGVLESLYAVNYYDESTAKLYYDNEVFDSEKKIWIREVPKNRKLVPSHLEVYRTYQETISLEEDLKSGYINLSVSHVSPLFSEYFLSLIINEANRLSKEKDMKESSDALTYLNKQLLNTMQSDIRKSMNKIIENQLKVQMLSNIKSDYLLSIIDRPYVPEVKSKPSRSIITITGSFIGFLVICSFILLNKYIFRFKFLG